MWFDCPRMGQPWHRMNKLYSKKFYHMTPGYIRKGKLGFSLLIFGLTHKGERLLQSVWIWLFKHLSFADSIWLFCLYGTGSGRSLDDSFTRSASFRRSKQVKAISNLIHGSSSGVKAMFRTTWTGSADELGRNRMSRSRSPSATPPTSGHSSPSPQRRETVKKHNHMYIETLLWQNFNMFYGGTIGASAVRTAHILHHYQLCDIKEYINLTKYILDLLPPKIILL